MNSQSTKAIVAGFVVLFLVTATSAYAQAPPSMKEVSGTYVNSSAGVTVTFPSGWSGFEIATPSGTIATTSPGGMSESDPATMKTIGLLVSDKSQGKDPKDPGSFSNDANDCNAPTIKSRDVAGVKGIEATVVCPTSKETIRMVTVQTSSNWIVLMYMAPTADFDGQVAAFDSTVSSLQVQGAVNSDAGAGGNNSGNDNSGSNLGLQLKTEIHQVLLQGKNKDISVVTNSTISNFRLEEQNKRVVFTVEGQSGTHGSTEIPIGQMLRGPYNVAIDGKSTTDFQVTNEGTENAMMKLSYTHSTHDITVTGTNVVPEFPIALVGAIAAIIGIVAVMGRTNLMGRKV